MARLMRRTMSLVAMLALATAVFGSSGRAAAQGQATTAAPGTWESAINLQNNSDQAASPVVINFYNADGTLIKAYTLAEPIPARGAVSIFVPAFVTDLASGQYSATVESVQPLIASVSTGSTNSPTPPWTSFAYEGVNAGETATSLFFPLLQKGYFNFFSEMVIQNAGASTANVTARFVNATGQTIHTANLGAVAPKASRTFPINAIQQLPSGDVAGIFGAVVTSTENMPLVGVANIWRTTPTAGTASYNAFTAGSNTLYAPALLKNYYGFVAALTLQNVHPTETASVTVAYSNGQRETLQLAPSAARALLPFNNPQMGSGDPAGLFAARVTTSGGSLVGVVSQSIPTGTSGAFAAYKAPNTASARVNVPSVVSDYYGYFTAVNVQNAGNAATNITITYAPSATCPGITTNSRTFNNVAAGQSVNILHLNNAGDVLPNNCATSAVVTSSGGQGLVATMQQNTAANVAGFAANKQPSDFLSAVTGLPQ
ncbi:MAG TPA: hypothetical protein VLA19_31700 [Herpetosiphonaceae bacterium]|nr:hypothetical protein [Herpetosiphonaceae bacterium]